MIVKSSKTFADGVTLRRLEFKNIREMRDYIRGVKPNKKKKK